MHAGTAGRGALPIAVRPAARVSPPRPAELLTTLRLWTATSASREASGQSRLFTSLANAIALEAAPADAEHSAAQPDPEAQLDVNSVVRGALATREKLPMALGASSLLIATLCNLSSPLMVAAHFGSLIPPGAQRISFYEPFLVAFCGLFAVEWLAHRIFQEQWLKTGEYTINELYLGAVCVLLRTQSVLRATSGDSILQLVAERERLRDILRTSCASPDSGLRGALKFLGSLVVVCVAAPTIAPFLIPAFLAAIAWVMTRATNTAQAEAASSAASGAQLARTAGILRALRFVRSSNGEHHELLEVHRLADQEMHAGVHVHLRTIDTQVVSAFTINSAWASMLFRASALYRSGDINIFQLQIALGCAMALTTSLSGTLHSLRDSLAARATLRRMQRLAATPVGESAGAPEHGAEMEGVGASNAALLQPRCGGGALTLGTLAVRPGRVATLSGPSGTGKSMLLDQLAGVQPLGSSRAAVCLNGEPLPTYTPAFRAIVSYCPQSNTNALPPGTVREVILGGCPQGEAKLMEAHELANLGTVPLDAHCDCLSGGQQQRVAHARAFLRVLSCGALFIVFDEPTSALDDPLARQFWASVLALVERTGVGVLTVTHDPEEVRTYYKVESDAFLMDASGDIRSAAASILQASASLTAR